MHTTVKANVLIIFCFVVIILVILGIATLSRSISENRIAQGHLNAAQAFWAAEGGINRTLHELRDNYEQAGNALFGGAIAGSGAEYSVDVAVAPGVARKTVTSHGYFPSQAAPLVERRIEVTIVKAIPPNFYDSAIFSAGTVDINGNSYNVTGKVTYADALDNEHPELVNGEVVQDPNIKPLARFDFRDLREMSVAQNNVYVPQGNDVVNAVTGSEEFPSSFWYTRGDDGIDDDIDGIVDNIEEWMPNIVYVECDLQLNGNIGTAGGFFVVVGDIITDPNEADNLTINGRGQIDGVVYTRGEFRVNGGGGTLNVNGGVWAGEEVRLNGNVDVQYNADYMAAIERLNADPAPQIVTWKDLQNPYPLTN